MGIENKHLYKLNWPFILFATLTPLVAVGGLLYLLIWHTIPWQTWVWAVIMYILTGISITAGYHRLFSHRSYQAHPIIKILMLFFGAAAFQNCVYAWCKDHRNHHLHVDTVKDPYNINQGFLYAHMTWLCYTLRAPIIWEQENIKDLMRDPLVKFQHDYYLPIAITGCFILPTAVAALWGDALGGLFIAGFLRVVICQHTTFMINSVAHYFGKKTYSQELTARDNWILSLVTLGEGFHNYHHAYPYDYRNGVRFYHWDPTKWLIKGLSYIKLTKNLRTVK